MFNIEEFDIKLDTDYIGRNFIYTEEVDSTNSTLMSSKDFNENGSVLLSEFQTKGRGRKDRIWESNAAQNLTFSIMLKDNLPANKINIINFAAAIAVAQAIENLYQLNVELKWPNDVLVEKKKIAGILIESVSKGNQISKVVIGIGINVNQPNFPGRYEIPPTSIRKEFHDAVNREKLLSEVLNNFEIIYEKMISNTPGVLNDWRQRCKMLGEKIKITEGEIVKIGLFEDIDENGFIILKNGDKREIIHFGDVSVR